MKKLIVAHYRALRRAGYRVDSARYWTGVKFGVSAGFVASVITNMR